LNLILEIKIYIVLKSVEFTHTQFFFIVAGFDVFLHNQMSFSYVVGIGVLLEKLGQYQYYLIYPSPYNKGLLLTNNHCSPQSKNSNSSLQNLKFNLICTKLAKFQKFKFFHHHFLIFEL
jgi:hypothetical protein